MFASHRPRVYRSARGCCICGSKSSSSRFTSSDKYEEDFPACFEVNEGSRTGLICNACVLLVKRWQKLPEESKRSWSHVVDGKCKTRKNSRRSSSTTKEDATSQSSGEVSVHFGENISVKRSDTPGESQGASCDQFIDSETPPPCSPALPPPCSPAPSDISSDCTISEDGRISTGCQTSFFFPQFKESEMKFPFIDLSGWRTEEVCCGTIFKGPNGEVLVDPKLLKPYCHCSRYPNRTFVKQSSEEGETGGFENS